MVQYQLCMRDEYGQLSIINNSDKLDELIKEGKSLVNNVNVENALTVDDKKRNWEAYFVEMETPKTNKVKLVFAGKDNKGKNAAFDRDTGEKIVVPSEKTKDANIKIYLGSIDRQDWYAEDNKRQLITSVDHADLLTKSVYFIRKN